MMKKFNNKNIAIVTGGTGGHIYPALTVYNQLLRKYMNIIFITDKRGNLNQELNKYNPKLINVKGYEGKSFLGKFVCILLILTSCIKAVLILKRKKVKLVIGFGSYVQVPVIIAAKLLKIDVILHEANAVLGRANKIFWSFVKYRTTAYNIDYRKLETILLGTPVRKEIVNLYSKTFKEPKRNQSLNILILGGSLGASVLSHNLSKIIIKLPYNLRKKIQITHQVRKEQKQKVIDEYKLANIKADVRGFIDNLPHHLKLSHLVISRAGASTVAENLIAGKPAIYIPLPSASGNHQFLNTKDFSKKKAAWVFREEELYEKNFLNILKKILSTKGILSMYSRNAKTNAKPDATKIFCKLVTGTLNANL